MYATDADWYEVQMKAFNGDGNGGATEQMVHTMPPNPNTTMPPTASWNIYQVSIVLFFHPHSH